jgi:hypothetical protein
VSTEIERASHNTFKLGNIEFEVNNDIQIYKVEIEFSQKDNKLPG